MFNVYLNNGDSIPDEQACYIISKDGIYLKKNLGMIQSITKVNKISFLETMQEEAQLNIDPIPVTECAKMLKFFRDVCETYYGSEAIALLYYNQNKNNYKIVIPPQIVSGGACDFKREISMVKEGYNLVGDIHTHGNGSAFHSGTDDTDEKTGVDGLHITFGHVGSDEISISTSITVNGKRFKIEPYIYLDGCEEIKKEESVPRVQAYKYIDGNLVKETFQSSYSYLNKRYKFSIDPKDVTYPKSWFEKVEYISNVEKRATYATESKNTRWNGYMAPGRFAQDAHFEGDWEKYWDSLYGNIGKPKQTHMMEGEYSFCEECKYKKKYLKIKAEGLVDLNEMDNELTPDDGSAAYNNEVDRLVEEQLTSDDFLNSAQSMDANHKDGEQIDIPENLQGKPKSWVAEFFGKLKS